VRGGEEHAVVDVDPSEHQLAGFGRNGGVLIGVE
jgi:hypothetical protein